MRPPQSHQKSGRPNHRIQSLPNKQMAKNHRRRNRVSVEEPNVTASPINSQGTQQSRQSHLVRNNGLPTVSTSEQPVSLLDRHPSAFSGNESNRVARHNSPRQFQRFSPIGHAPGAYHRAPNQDRRTTSLHGMPYPTATLYSEVHASTPASGGAFDRFDRTLWQLPYGQSSILARDLLTSCPEDVPPVSSSRDMINKSRGHTTQYTTGYPTSSTGGLLQTNDFSVWMPNGTTQTTGAMLAKLNVLKERALLADSQVSEHDDELPVTVTGNDGEPIQVDYHWLVACMGDGQMHKCVIDSLLRALYRRADQPFYPNQHRMLTAAMYMDESNTRPFDDESQLHFQARHAAAVQRMRDAATYLVNVPQVVSIIYTGGHFIAVNLCNANRSVTVYDSVGSGYYAQKLSDLMSDVSGIAYTHSSPAVARQSSPVDRGLGRDCGIHASINCEHLLHNRIPPRHIDRNTLTGRRVLAMFQFLSKTAPAALLNRTSVVQLNTPQRTPLNKRPSVSVSTAVEQVPRRNSPPVADDIVATPTTDHVFSGTSPTTTVATAQLLTGVSRRSAPYQTRSRTANVASQNALPQPVPVDARPKRVRPKEAATSTSEKVNIVALTKWVEGGGKGSTLTAEGARYLPQDAQLSAKQKTKRSKNDCLVAFYESKQEETLDMELYPLIHGQLKSSVHRRVAEREQLDKNVDDLNAKEVTELTAKWVNAQNQTKHK